MDKQVKLATFTTGDYNKGASLIKRTLWYFVNALLVRASWNPFAAPKIWLLRLFGAKIGTGLVMKNNVNIKSPWNLTIGNDCWIGENAWIDNLDTVEIGNDVCISQGVLLLTGNHDYKSTSFDYMNAPIKIEDGAWVGAKSTVCPGVTVRTHAILTVNSVATRDLEAWKIYQGNPAVAVRERRMYDN